MEEEIEKMFFIFNRIAFELGAINSHSLEQDTCYRQWMC